MRDLGVRDESLRNIFKKYIKFFGNKERYKRFASYSISYSTEESVNISIFSALCKLSIPDFQELIKTLLKEIAINDSKHLEEIKKYGDLDVFWELIEKRYGYHLEEKSLKQLMIMFLVTDINHNLDVRIPASWEKYISAKKGDFVVFINHFMNHNSDGEVYNLLANNLEKTLGIKEYIKKWDMESYLECDTFRAFDDEIIGFLISNLVENIGEYERYRRIINKRRTTHWFKKLSNEYETIYYGMEILQLESELEKNIKGTTSYQLIDNYTKSYFLFDLFYRKFYLYYDRIENKDIFTELVEVVENTYNRWFLEELSIKWSQFIEDELNNDVKIDGLVKQNDFYSQFVKPFVNKEERIFVIISDAFRYEAAKEFSDILNRDRQGKAELTYMQGVVPSYTKLGMASLLPHKKIEMLDNADILVDGISSAGTDNRQKILSSYSEAAIVIQYNGMKDMKRPEYQEKFSNKKLIYIYHNAIDAIGDKASTEREVFEAVEKAFNDLNDLIKALTNNVSAINIIITSDHGFIYSRSALQEYDKVTKVDVKPIDAGRRFILSQEKVEEHGILSIPMNNLLGSNSNLNAIIPKGIIRFKVQGAGANFVHGGASLQEIVVPVIKFKYIRKEEYKSSKVEVKLTNISRKITNRITFLEFFQSDVVDEKKMNLRLKLYFEDEEGNRISNENIIIADSRSSKPENRTYREKFTLKDQAFDKTKKYYLILEDEDETVEKIYEKIPFMIDLAITNDFGF